MAGFAGRLVKQKSFRLFNIPLNTLPESPGQLLELGLLRLSKLTDLTWTPPDGSLVDIAVREIAICEIAISLSLLQEILRECPH